MLTKLSAAAVRDTSSAAPAPALVADMFSDNVRGIPSAAAAAVAMLASLTRT